MRLRLSLRRAPSGTPVSVFVGYREERVMWLGAFEAPEGLVPEFASERLGWSETADDLPCHPRLTAMREDPSLINRCGPPPSCSCSCSCG